MVIEAKADETDFEQAMQEAAHYGDACRDANHQVIAVGIAGQEQTNICIGVLKYMQGQWQRVVYAENPISWLPTQQDVTKLLSSPNLLDLAPVIPSPEVLANKADLINRILREAHVKDEYRPAYVGAMMLALWQSHGAIRKDPEFVLRDINSACEDAYAKGGKAEKQPTTSTGLSVHRSCADQTRTLAFQLRQKTHPIQNLPVPHVTYAYAGTMG